MLKQANPNELLTHHKKIILPLDIYYEHLQNIRGVEFTPREVDVIACILNGRASTSSAILSIKQRAIETHTRNIRQKAGGLPGRESIVDFIETSEKAPLIKNEYYLNLQIRVFFENQLQILKKTMSESANCICIYDEGEAYKPFFIPSLEKYLKLAGVNLSHENKNGREKPLLIKPTNEVTSQQINYVLCIAPPNNIKIRQRAQKYAHSSRKLLFFFPEEKPLTDAALELEGTDFVDFSKQPNYYLSFFEILKKIFPDHNFDLMISDFVNYCEKICSSSEKMYPSLPLDLKPSKNKIQTDTPHDHINSHDHINFLVRFIRKKNSLFLISFFFLCFSGVLIFKIGGAPQSNKLAPSLSIRSDLSIPTENALLKRSELLAEIETKFKGQQGIKTVALLGIGGAGKTITARQYARAQNSLIVWEINAETNQSLLRSFESLAESLAKTEKDENILKKLKDAKNTAEKEAKLLSFIKEKLRASPQWLLIYDNVENFADIQSYFPNDVSNWGEGKVLLTTPNSNIQSNKNINNIINVSELDNKQKLDFFIKLMKNGAGHSFSFDQVEDAKKFLEGLPPFPLDISIAASYLKATHTSYKNYLERLHKQEEGFVEVQENLLKEGGGYKNRRHDIIIMSLKQIINADEEFKDLLLFISLLDSQSIPRDLLNDYKGDDAVDSFIYNLKKYSLITNEVMPSSRTEGTISIHRSTQEICLAYLSTLLHLQRDNELLLASMAILEKYMADAVEKGDVSKMMLLVTHCEKILSHENFIEATGVLSHAGGIYRWLWNTEKAEDYLRKAIHNYEVNFPNKFNERGVALTYLGLFYRDNGKYQKAQDVLKEAVESFKKDSKKNIWLGTSLVTLGNTYRDIGNYKEAEALIEEGISFYNKNFPHHHFQIGVALSYLGAIERELGNYDKARIFLEEGIKNYKKDSENNVWFAWTLIHLAEIYRTLGNYEKALRLAEKSVSFYKETFSESSPNVAWALMLLGHVYSGLEEYEKSQDLLEKNIYICKEIFGDDHVRTVKGLRWLAYTYRKTGEYAKAKKILHETLATYARHYGESHIQSGRVLRNLGQVYLAEGNLEQAEHFINKALAILQPYKCDDRYMCLENLAEIYLKKSAQERKAGETQKSQLFAEKAIDCLAQSLEVLIKAKFPKESPHVLRIKAKLDNSKETLKRGVSPEF